MLLATFLFEHLHITRSACPAKKKTNNSNNNNPDNFKDANYYCLPSISFMCINVLLVSLWVEVHIRSWFSVGMRTEKWKTNGKKTVQALHIVWLRSGNIIAEMRTCSFLPMIKEPNATDHMSQRLYTWDGVRCWSVCAVVERLWHTV